MMALRVALESGISAGEAGKPPSKRANERVVTVATSFRCVRNGPGIRRGWSRGTLTAQRVALVGDSVLGDDEREGGEAPVEAEEHVEETLHVCDTGQSRRG